MKKIYSLILVSITGGSLMFTACKNNQENMNKEAQDFITSYENKVKELSKQSGIAYWNAAISGKDEDYAKSSEVEIKLSKIYADTTDFATLKKLKAGNITDTLLKRQIEVIYNDYAPNQVDVKKLEEVINLGIAIEQKFSTFRADVNGKKLSDNEIENILGSSKKSDEVKTAWLGHKNIGNLVSQDIIKLVKLRNEIAKSLGFNNYHEMSLKLSEQDPEQIETLFDELDSLTRGSFVQIKSQIDDFLAKKFNIKKEELMPWHYQNRYFQEGPKVFDVDLDNYYKNQDVVKLTADYFKGIGMDIEDLIKNSDLYEKPGKNQHAFCTDIDKEGDVRVLCNVKNDVYWMNTMLHEYGHAVYNKFASKDVPYSLREPAHTFTTEAIAMIFGRFASNPQWIKDMTGISEEEKNKIATDCANYLRFEQLVFSRWSQVMYRFEKAMYANPDQDLNKLWWDLVEKYQLLKRPTDRNAPDWATKVHIATSPCYYHNYLMGELLASQLYFTITEKVLNVTDGKPQSFVNKPEVGKFLIDKVFKVGKIYDWNTMIEKATGEKLTAKYYAKQFVN